MTLLSSVPWAIAPLPLPFIAGAGAEDGPGLGYNRGFATHCFEVFAMSVHQTIEAKLQQALAPQHLDVVNESYMHSGQFRDPFQGGHCQSGI